MNSPSLNQIVIVSSVSSNSGISVNASKNRILGSSSELLFFSFLFYIYSYFLKINIHHYLHLESSSTSNLFKQTL